MAKHAVATPDAPAPVGPYSQGIRAEGLIVTTAGQVGIDPATGAIAGEDSATQTRQAIKNLEAVLVAAGATLHDVVRVGVYLTDIADFAAMNAVYEELMPMPRPARTTVYVGLPPELRIELDAIAVVDGAGH